MGILTARSSRRLLTSAAAGFLSKCPIRRPIPPSRPLTGHRHLPRRSPAAEPHYPPFLGSSRGPIHPNFAFLRHSSTAIEHVSGDKAFENMCIKNLSVKPLVIDRVEEEPIDAETVGDVRDGEAAAAEADADESEKLDGGGSVALGGLETGSEVARERVVSEMEREAWRLLNHAVVSYCRSPVGTVAANDPAEANQTLNYDQVFLRDFVPSALAFLLKGESEIVRNFLLHTLQLQVKCVIFS